MRLGSWPTRVALLRVGVGAVAFATSCAQVAGLNEYDGFVSGERLDSFDEAADVERWEADADRDAENSANDVAVDLDWDGSVGGDDAGSLRANVTFPDKPYTGGGAHLRFDPGEWEEATRLHFWVQLRADVEKVDVLQVFAQSPAGDWDVAWLVPELEEDDCFARGCRHTLDLTERDSNDEVLIIEEATDLYVKLYSLSYDGWEASFYLDDVWLE